jgi:sugar lactone lactonase YvrE
MTYVVCRERGTLALSAALVGSVIGCSASKQMAPKPTGSMTVTVNAADGTEPSVVITGPNSFSATITSTQTLSGLSIGSYAIVADSAVGPDSVVGTIIDTGSVTGSPATVANSATAAVSVSYAMKRRVGGLWLANNSNGTVPELASSQLRHSGRTVPAETLATKVSGPAGLALDASGNMWESSWKSDSLLMYTPAARNAFGGAPPSKVIVSTALQRVRHVGGPISLLRPGGESLAFDAHGNLWVPNCGTGTILEFTLSQLAAGGTQTPAVTIGGAGGCPFALAFDTAGNVWVSDAGGSHISEFSAAQLRASASPIPIDTIGALGNTSGLAFDAKGNLWVASSSNRSVFEFTPAQQAAGGAPIPTVTVTMPIGALLYGAAFDRRGSLWVSDVNNGIVYALTSSQLATSSPTPAVADTVSWGGSFQPEQLLFDPYVTAAGVSAARMGHPVAPLARAVQNANSKGGQRITP